jgi:acetyl-CoA/propionyl-CoA carboxylase biotin carboxyl carrier protein
VEFLLAPDGEFYFLEMNTRIQVEHPITEAVAGVDLIREMVLAAAGEPIGVEGTLLDPDGHAIEVRVNAENPLEGFRPTPRLINAYREPGGIGVRVDSGVYAGFTVPDAYDSLLAKVIVWAPDRERARLRMLRALAEYRIEGPDTTIPFAQALLETPAFARGDVYTTYVEEHLEDLQGAVRQRVPTAGTPLANPSLTAPAYTRSDERSFEVEVNRKLFRVRVAELQPERSDRRGKPAAPRRRAAAHQAELLSPMHGTVVKVAREEGEQVQEGEALFVIEAMKMENEVPAQRTGTLVSVDVQAGQSVEAGQRLAVIE